MKTYQTGGGYFYKIYKNGKKVRISKEKFMKLKGNKQRGGAAASSTYEKSNNEKEVDRWCNLIFMYLKEGNITLRSTSLLKHTVGRIRILDKIKAILPDEHSTASIKRFGIDVSNWAQIRRNTLFRNKHFNNIESGKIMSLKYVIICINKVMAELDKELSPYHNFMPQHLQKSYDATIQDLETRVKDEINELNLERRIATRSNTTHNHGPSWVSLVENRKRKNNSLFNVNNNSYYSTSTGAEALLGNLPNPINYDSNTATVPRRPPNNKGKRTNRKKKK